MFDKYELDDRGILPQIGESVAQFVERGNQVLLLSARLSDQDLIDNILEDGRLPYPLNFQLFDYDKFDYDNAARQDALLYLLKKYGLDMSWVRFVAMHTDDFIQKMLGGVAIRQLWTLNHRCLIVPVIAVRELSFVVVRHELLHASRAAIDQPRSFLRPHEENVANDRFYRARFWDRLHLSGRIRNLYRARNLLEKYFGEKAGYIFIRLSEREAIQALLRANNPVEFIRDRSWDNPLYYRNLKFKIMADKLGL